MSILITGGLGFVGGRLARCLSRSYLVTISSRSKPEKEKLQAHGAIGAVEHHTLLKKDTFPGGMDTVIHMAALNEWDCVKHPSEAIRVNIDETRLILENSISAGVRHFIYFSTAHIYGSPLQGYLTEESLPAPVHPYAITHRAAEDYVMAMTRQGKIHGIVLRLTNSFGAPVLPDVNRWTLLTNDLARQAVETGRLKLLSNGCQHRDFICLHDVEQVVFDIVTRGPASFKQQVYNLASGTSMTVIEMARRISNLYKALFSIDLPIDLPANAALSVEPDVHFSTERLLSEGIVIENNLDDELTDLLHFCRRHFKYHG